MKRCIECKEKIENKISLNDEINNAPLTSETDAHQKSDKTLAYHPSQNFKFPVKKVGNRNCQAHHIWFEIYKWLTYDSTKDSVFCFICKTVYEEKKLLTKPIKTAFIEGAGFSDWLHGPDRFSKHEQTSCHKEACSKFDSDSKKDIRAVMSSDWQKKEEQSRRNLLIIIDYIKYLGRQGIAFRGNDSDKEGNFYQLLLVDSRKNKEFCEWLEKKTFKYTSPEIQNEIIKIMSDEILRGVIENIKSAKFFAYMADETCDISNTEQLTNFVRWIDGDFCEHEDFIGLHSVDKTNADYLVSIVENIFTMYNLEFQNMRGQAYDGASNMKGHKSGVKTQILAKNERALFVHCYAHSLNLAVGDTLKQISCLKDGLCMCNEIINLIKKSPKREAILRVIKEVNFVLVVHYIFLKN